MLRVMDDATDRAKNTGTDFGREIGREETENSEQNKRTSKTTAKHESLSPGRNEAHAIHTARGRSNFSPKFGRATTETGRNAEGATAVFRHEKAFEARTA